MELLLRVTLETPDTMASITFQVVEGLEAGRIFKDVQTPFTIGREEDNDIQLNDERISRFHVKVQEESGRMILTDLDSTNGTRVNGHPVRLRVLQPGDLVMLGRSVLLVGGPNELKRLSERLIDKAKQFADHEVEKTASGKVGAAVDPSELVQAFPTGIPPVPTNLTTTQTAELVDLLEFLRTEILSSINSPTEELHTSDGTFMRVDRGAWLALKKLSPDLSRIILSLTNPR